MALTENQVNDYVQKSAGRPATPYELKTFAGYPIQTLANLGNYYSSRDQSTLPGYLQYTGQEYSPSNISALGKQYGVPNTGTPTGDSALLNALKTKNNTPQSSPSLSGTIPNNPPQEQPAQTQETQTQDSSGKPVFTGSIPGSTGQDTSSMFAPGYVTSTGLSMPQKPGIDPMMETTKSQYNNIQNQISEIDNALASALNDKVNAIKQSGGVVDMAALRAELSNEQQPLMEQRRELVTQGNFLNNSYKDMLTMYNDSMRQYNSDLNSYLRGVSIDQAQQKMAVQNSQFEKSLTQRGIKYLKFTDQNTGNTYYIDPSTNRMITWADITPQTSTTTQDQTGNSAMSVNNVSGMLDSSGNFVKYDSTDQSFQATVGKVSDWVSGKDSFGINGNSSLHDFVNMWITGTTKGNNTQGYTAEDVGKYLGVTSGTKISEINPTKLAGAIANFETGYDYTNGNFEVFNNNDASRPSSNPVVADKEDPTTGRTQNSLWNDSIKYALIGGNLQQFTGGLSNSGQQKNYKNAVANKSSALVSASGANPAFLQSEYKALSAAQKTQVDYLYSVSRAMDGAERSSNITTQFYKDNPNINQNDSTWLNSTINKAVSLFGKSGDIRGYKSSMVEIGNEYAQLFARGGQRSVEGNNLAQEVVNGDVKIGDIQKTFDRLQAIAQQVVGASIDTISNISNGVGTQNVVKFLKFIDNVGNNTSGNDRTQYQPIAFDVPQDYNYNYEKDFQAAQEAVQNGSDPSQVWGYFNSIYK